MCIAFIVCADVSPPSTLRPHLSRHMEYCQAAEPARVVMPKKEEATLSFSNFNKMLKCPYVIYADTESLIKPLDKVQAGKTTRDSIHEACSFAYVVVRADGTITSSQLYRGEDAMRNFFWELEREEETIRKDLSNIIPMDLSEVSCTYSYAHCLLLCLHCG